MFSKYDFEKNGDRITGYSFSEITKSYYIYIYIEKWDYQNQL